MSIDGAVEATFRRDRLVVSAALLILIALSLTYVLGGAGMGMSALEMTRMGSGVQPAVPVKGSGEGPMGMGAMRMTTPAVWTPG